MNEKLKMQRETKMWCVTDAQMEVDIRNYDMHEALMAPEGKFLFLKVPGLSENR